MSLEMVAVICLFSWIPMLAFTKLVRALSLIRMESRGKQNPKEVARLQVELAEVRKELEALRSTATGFDLSFDKRLSEMELQLRISKLQDVQSRYEQTQ